jgi:hypothetical protein
MTARHQAKRIWITGVSFSAVLKISKATGRPFRESILDAIAFYEADLRDKGRIQ